MITIFKNFVQDETGATAIEYGLIAALVSVAAVAALGTMGTSLSSMFGVVSGQLDAAITAASGGTPTTP
jgi:pilus assembly protein Flp/PilA